MPHVTAGHPFRARAGCLLAGLVLAGCGGPDGAGRATEAAPPPAPAVTGVSPAPSPQLSRALAAGRGVAVVDLAGAAHARPVKLEIAKDATLSGLRWSGWGRPRAVGEGTLSLLECEPTCAEGRVRTVPARVILHDLRRCSTGRFYAAASVAPDDPRRTPPPAAYLQPPC